MIQDKMSYPEYLVENTEAVKQQKEAETNSYWKYIHLARMLINALMLAYLYESSRT